MSYDITVDAARPLVTCTIGEGFSVAAHAAPMRASVLEAIERQPQPVYYIFDARRLTITFDEFMEAIGAAVRGSRPPIHHPNLIQMFVVTNNSFLTTALNGMRAAAFGSLRIRPVASLEDAYRLIDDQSSP